MGKNALFSILILSISFSVFHSAYCDDTEEVDFSKSTAKEEDFKFTYYESDSSEPKVYTSKDKPTDLKKKADKVVFILHGSNQNDKTPWVGELIKNFLKTKRHVVIFVDWSNAAKTHEQAADNTQFAGKTVADFIKAAKLGGQDCIIVGFGTGGHAAGQAGKIMDKAGNKLGHIYALDPSGPKFEYPKRAKKTVPREKKLTEFDASYVYGYHTNCQKHGIKDTVGRVDYYVHDGNSQPGCSDDECSHVRAAEIFAETFLRLKSAIQVNVRISQTRVSLSLTRSNKEDYIGIYASPNTEGTWGFDTKSASPYLA